MDEQPLSRCDRILALQDAVLEEWSRRLRVTVKEATHLPQPIVINTFPGLYQSIVQSMAPDYPRDLAIRGNTIAAEHGGERARLTNYTAQSVVMEYQLLRWTILDVLNAHDIHLDSREFWLVNSAMDEAIRESVNAFALAQAALRERFVAALTHDLRNPLATASVATDLIQLSNDLPRIRELAAHIRENLARMDGMIQDLLDAMIFQSGERLPLKLTEFDMYDLITDVIEYLRMRHGPRFAFAGQPVTGWWDREIVRRTLENLMGNAVKYGAQDSLIDVSLQSQHGRLIIQVHNQGEPIPQDQLEFVFQVFGRTESAKDSTMKGWGLGLPFVRSVAESHGGSIGVDSGAERGTTFTFDIPVDARPYLQAPILAPLLPGQDAP